MPRKRTREESDVEPKPTVQENGQSEDPKSKLRNMWQFASLMQFIFLFGKAVKIDEDIDIEELEDMCLQSDKKGGLADIGLTMLKYISSHRALTPDLFDEYTRRQFVAKAPLRNPYGTEEEPRRFSDFDVFTKIKILQQLSIWTFGNADRIRQLMPETEADHANWRIEPFGWDSCDHTYILLDDDRLYRRTDPPLPIDPPQAKTQPKSRAKARSRRSAKRRKLSEPVTLSDGDGEDGDDGDDAAQDQKDEVVEDEDDGFGGMKWECVAVSLEEYQTFLETIKRSRDPNEKALFRAITENVIPLLEKRAEAQRQKMLKKQRELENLQKLAMAKRSSRIADKMERQKKEEEEAAAERKRLAEIKMARQEQERQSKMEEARTSRMHTREQRIRERESKRILHEAELNRLEQMEQMEVVPNDVNGTRHSSRQLQSEKERQQMALEKLNMEADKWVFDCAGCGKYGENLDDGTHSIACDKCGIWQHLRCNGIPAGDAEREDFHFTCSDCRRKEEDAKKPRIPPLKLGRVDGSSPSGQSISVNGHGDLHHPATSTDHDINHVSTVRENNAFRTSSVDANNSNDEDRQPQHTNAGQILDSVRATDGIESTTIISPADQAFHREAHDAALATNGLHQGRSTHLPPPFPPHQSGFAQELNALHDAGVDHTSQQVPSITPSFPRPHSPLAGHTPSTHIGQASTVMDRQGSPTKTTHTPVPFSSNQHRQQESPVQTHDLPSLQESPYLDLSPPAKTLQEQRLAGLSPVKQISPSPQSSFRAPFLSNSSPSRPPPLAATPITQTPHMPPLMSSPQASSYLAATPREVYSPIPPVGEGPVIPQKHDQPARPAMSDHVSDIPAFPPSKILSPTHTEDGRGMGTQAGHGGLGTGSVPVKKLPPTIESSPPPPPLPTLPSFDT